MEPYTRHLVTNEVAALFGVSRRTIIRWTHEGLLESVKPGGKILYPADQPAIQRLFKNQRNGESVEND
jgi:excisionase family DNA binding protein